LGGIMKNYANNADKKVRGLKYWQKILSVVLILTFVVLLGKLYLVITATTYHAKSLRIDHRYKQEIDFDIIGMQIPIKQDSTFIRIDGSVSDLDKHQEVLLEELDIVPQNIIYTNAATTARHMHLTFADGKTCSFIWVLKHSDDRITRIRIEHEKYHALYHISPKDISLLSEKIKGTGFNIDLRDYDEETSATIVKILSAHLLGVPFDQISGSGLIEQAKEILVTSYVEPVAPADADH
jgi:hypothetical protein